MDIKWGKEEGGMNWKTGLTYIYIYIYSHFIFAIHLLLLKYNPHEGRNFI